MGVLLLRGCELAAADDVVHEAEHTLADDILVYGHVRLEVGNLLVKLLDLGVRGIVCLLGGIGFSACRLPLAVLLLTDPDESVVLGLLVALDLLRLLVCSLSGGVLAGRIAELRVRLVVCGLRGRDGGVRGVDALLSGGDGGLCGLEVRLGGCVGSSRGVKGALRGCKLVGGGVLSSLERIQIDTRARSSGIERGLRLIQLLLGVVTCGGCSSEGSGGLLLLCLSGCQSRLGIPLCLLGIGDSRLSGIELTLGSLHVGVRCIEFCLRVLDGLLGGLVFIHAHGLELGLGVIEGFLSFVALCVGILERLGLVIDALIGLIELVVQVAQLLLLLLGLVDGRLKLVDLLLKRGDICRVLLGRVVAQGLSSMVSVLLGLLLRFSRGINLLLGGVVGLLGGLELLCRLLGKLGSRLCDRLVTGGNGVLYRTTPPLNRIAVIG